MSTVDDVKDRSSQPSGSTTRPRHFVAAVTQLPGQTLQLDGRSRVPLPHEESCWLVLTGEVHLRPVDRQVPAARRAVIQVGPEGLIGGAQEPAGPLALLASGTVGTTVRVVPWSSLTAGDAGSAAWLPLALDNWVLALTGIHAGRRAPAGSGAGGVAAADPSTTIRASGEHRLEAGAERRLQGPTWLLVREGSVQTDDGRRAGTGEVIACPTTMQLHADDASQVAVLDASGLVAEVKPQRWGNALVKLADLALRDLAGSDDSAGQRALTQQTARDDLGEAVGRLANLLGDGPPGPRAHADPLRACLIELGVHPDALPEAESIPGDTDITRRLAALARSGVVRTRAVLLDPGWQAYDNGDLLALTSASSGDDTASATIPVLLRRRRAGYQVFDPTTGIWRPVHSVADRLATHAHQIYLPLRARPRRGRQPEGGTGPMRLGDLVSRGLAAGLPDLFVVLLAAGGAGLLGLVAPLLTAQIFGRILPDNDQALLAQAAVALVLAALAVGAFVSTQSFAVERLAQQLQWRWQAWVLDRLLRLPATFFREHTPGALSARLLDLDSVRNTVTSVVAGPVLSLLFAGFGVALMFAIAPSLAGPAVVVLVPVAAVSLLFAWRQSRAATAVAALDRAEQSALVAVLTGMAKLRVAQAEERVFARRLDVALERGRHQVRFESVSSVLTVLAATVPVVATAVLWAAAGAEAQQSAEQRISAGAYLGFSAAFTTVLGAVFGVVTNARSLVEAVPRVAALRPILAAVPENDRRGADPGALSGLVELNGVSFAYPGGPPVLTDVSFRVEPGEMVAVVGPSGSGKSTLVRLLLGFDRPTTGKVFYDDQDLDGLDVTAVRRQLGVVLQNDRLFGGELARCILGASPLGIDAAWRAAELAGVADDIRAMPMGMHTPLDARGSTISGGQRQRLAIARALVSGPRVLLFDEATSALDNRTQEAVTESLEGLPATRIVIAHRLSTVRRADRVVVLDKGRILETGTVPELLAAGGTFAAIARRQQL